MMSLVSIALGFAMIANPGIIMALVSIALGFAMIANPGISMDVIIKLCGCILILVQIFSLYDSFYILRRVNDVSKTIKDAKSTEK